MITATHFDNPNQALVNFLFKMAMNLQTALRGN